jgi:hypothetical protein
MTEQEMLDKIKQYESDALAAAKAATPTTIKWILGSLVLVLLVVAGYAGYLHFKPEPKPVEITKPLIVQTQGVNTHTETIREVTVQAAPKGNIMQFIEREGKQYVVIEGKEYQLASTTGPTKVKIGENGQIVMSTETVAKLDITETVRAQVNDKLAIQAAELKKKYEKNWTVGGEITNKDISADITHKGLGITAGYTWDKKDLRIGPRFETKF